MSKQPELTTGLCITETELLAELAAIEAESIGWLPLGDGAYLHLGKPEEEEIVITVTGVPDAGMAGMNVLWWGGVRGMLILADRLRHNRDS